MNLILDPWIPVLRASGAVQRLAPCDITSLTCEGEPVALASPRADLSAALYQFLIGLLQTFLSPDDDDAWAEWYRHPPSAQQLEAALASAAGSFELGGEGPRFLQDLTLEDGKLQPIGDLLVDRHSEHFIKPGSVRAMCEGCAAAALLCLQVNAPSGGRGHRTGIRGGGPLTTLLTPSPGGDALWRRCWLNVLPRGRMQSLTGNPERKTPGELFPWLAPARTSEKITGRQTTPDDMAPEHVFWAMPRRLRLELDQLSEGACDICSRPGPVVTQFRSRPSGFWYTGPWLHPLSPYSTNQDGERLARHPARGGIGYRDWAALVVGEGDDTRAAEVVGAAYARRRDLRGDERVWAFGFDVVPGQANVRGWHEAVMPIHLMDVDGIGLLRHDAVNLLQAATLVAGNLRARLKDAWFRPGAEARGDLSFVTQSFWSATEEEFFVAVRALAGFAERHEEPEVALFHRWHRVLKRASEALFDLWSVADIAYADPRRVTKARLKLLRFNHQAKIREALRLPSQRPAPDWGQRGGPV